MPREFVRQYSLPHPTLSASRSLVEARANSLPRLFSASEAAEVDGGRDSLSLRRAAGSSGGDDENHYLALLQPNAMPHDSTSEAILGDENHYLAFLLRLFSGSKAAVEAVKLTGRDSLPLRRAAGSSGGFRRRAFRPPALPLTPSAGGDENHYLTLLQPNTARKAVKLTGRDSLPLRRAAGSSGGFRRRAFRPPAVPLTPSVGGDENHYLTLGTVVEAVKLTGRDSLPLRRAARSSGGIRRRAFRPPAVPLTPSDPEGRTQNDGSALLSLQLSGRRISGRREF
ncbi:hypothetical protein Bbelb_375940 [Branchiostoma belcheri]|nr:hypothetical protein Bbelb_375940 [Branchiostoma belcheri]